MSQVGLEQLYYIWPIYVKKPLICRVEKRCFTGVFWIKIWASAGFSGNSHDSVIPQATELYQSLTVSDVLPPIFKNENGVDIHPLILGDSALPFKNFLMKPYTNAVLTPEHRYFNYRLSRARMVTEGAYKQLKGRWHILYRKCESSPDNVKIYTLACIVLHNICMDRGDTSLRQRDLSKDPQTNKRRPREKYETSYA